MLRALRWAALALLLTSARPSNADPVPYVRGPQPAADIAGTLNQVIGNINGQLSAISSQANGAGGGLSRGYLQAQLAVQASNTVYSAGAVTYAGGTYTALAGTQPVPLALAAGQTYFVNFRQANLSAANLTIANLPSKALKVLTASGTALTLSGGEIVAGPATVYYDGTQFIYSAPTALTTPVTAPLTATQADFAGATVFYLTSAQTLTLPCSATLSPNGRVFVFSTSGAATIAIGSGCTSDTVTKNGSSSGTSTTIAAGAALAVIVTDSAGHFYVSGS